MRDIVTKNTGDSLSADEFNDIPGELENSITDTGQTLTAADLFQLSKAMSVYAAGGSFFTDSGIADAYVLSTIGSKKSPPVYFDGQEISFVVGNANTAASTVNVGAAGLKDLRTSAGTVFTGGELPLGDYVSFRFDFGANHFKLLPAGGGAVGGGSDKVFYENDQNVTVDYELSAGTNAMTAGPITIDNGITVTIPNGAVWTVV